MKLALVSILSIFVFSTNAIADHHGHSAGKLSMTSNGEFLLDTTNVGGIKFTTGELKGLSNVSNSSYATLPDGTVLSFSCTGSSLEKDGKSTLYALCTVKDKDGDEIMMENSREGAIGVPGPGNSLLKGVSGKFANLVGTCTYIPTYMMNGGVFVSVSFDCDMKH